MQSGRRKGKRRMLFLITSPRGRKRMGGQRQMTRLTMKRSVLIKENKFKQIQTLKEEGIDPLLLNSCAIANLYGDNVVFHIFFVRTNLHTLLWW